VDAQGHPDPQNLSDLFAGAFQSCWITPDFDAGVARLRGFGMTFEALFEPEVDFQHGGEVKRVKLKAALGSAAGGAHSVEVLQPIEDPIGIFISMLEGVPQDGMRFHHIGIFTPDLERARAALQNDGLDFVCSGSTPEAEFGLVDMTRTLGHYLELVRPLPAAG
jgi:hypothetical protein